MHSLGFGIDMQLINREWGVEGAAFIKGKEYPKRTLRLIACLARRSDVPNLATGLAMVNSRAVYRILEGTNHYLQRSFVTPDGCKKVQDMAVPSRDFPIDNLVAAKVHLNNLGEIAPGRPLFL